MAVTKVTKQLTIVVDVHINKDEYGHEPTDERILAVIEERLVRASIDGWPRYVAHFDKVAYATEIGPIDDD